MSIRCHQIDIAGTVCQIAREHQVVMVLRRLRISVSSVLMSASMASSGLGVPVERDFIGDLGLFVVDPGIRHMGKDFLFLRRFLSGVSHRWFSEALAVRRECLPAVSCRPRRRLQMLQIKSASFRCVSAVI
jgi:hypothetical protein